MNLYLAAVAIGVGLIAIWVGWLLAVRTYLRRTRSRPGDTPFDSASDYRAAADTGGLPGDGPLFCVGEYHRPGRDEDLSADLDPHLGGGHGRVDSDIPGYQEDGGTGAAGTGGTSDESGRAEKTAVKTDWEGLGSLTRAGG